jgi:hypothetical protein
MLLFVVTLVYASEQFTEVAIQHDLSLPLASVLMLNMGNSWGQMWYLFLPLFMVVDAAVIFALSLTPPRFRWIRSICHTLFLLSILALSCGVTLAVLVPMHAALRSALVVPSAQPNAVP